MSNIPSRKRNLRSPDPGDSMYRDLTERRETGSALRRLAARLLALQDDERRGIARALHDSTGQDLAALEMTLVQLEASSRDVLGEVERRALWKSIALVEQCSEQVRSLSYQLHPPLLDELGLEVALRELVEGFSLRTEIPVSVEVSSDVGRLGADIEMALFRIAQECLVNVHRHSGSATAELRLTTLDGEVHLEVRDRGHGVSEAEALGPRSVGIRAMRERVHGLGGRLRIDSGPDGTTVYATLPTASGGRVDP